MISALRTLTLALLLALSLAVPASARDFLRAETPRFTIYSDGYPFELQRWARKLEWFDAVLRGRLGSGKRPAGSRLTVYLLEDAAAVQRLTGQPYLAGAYYQSSEGAFLIANRRPDYDTGELSGQETLFHEYAHHFMYRHSPTAYPAWYREGFAEYVSTVDFDAERRWTFGAPPQHRMNLLRKNPVPIETLLFAEVDAIAARDRARFYAWSWLLVHMIEADPARKARLEAYLAAFAGGQSPQQAARALGDLKQLERDLRAYAKAPLRYRRSGFALEDPGGITVSELSPAASQIVRLTLQRKVGSDPAATSAALAQLSQATPGNAEALFELAALERGTGGTMEQALRAVTATNRVLDIAPDHPGANILHTQLMIRRHALSGGTLTLDWQAERQRLRKVIAADPVNALALTELFRTYLAERKQVPPEAFAAIEQAFALQPETARIRTLHAWSLALRGRFDEARALAQVLVSDPHRTEQGQRALETINRMQRGTPAAEPPME